MPSNHSTFLILILFLFLFFWCCLSAWKWHIWTDRNFITFLIIHIVISVIFSIMILFCFTLNWSSFLIQSYSLFFTLSLYMMANSNILSLLTYYLCLHIYSNFHHLHSHSSLPLFLSLTTFIPVSHYLYSCFSLPLFLILTISGCCWLECWYRPNSKK